MRRRAFIAGTAAFSLPLPTTVRAAPHQTVDDAVATLGQADLVELFSGCLDVIGLNPPWRNRYEYFVRPAVAACFLRSRLDGIPVSTGLICDAMSFESMHEAGADRRIDPDVSRDCLRWLAMIPGYSDDGRAWRRQPQTSIDQHGYCEMSVVRAVRGLGRADARAAALVAAGCTDWTVILPGTAKIEGRW